MFEQAAIKVEREREFDELKGVVEDAFRPERVESFFKRLQREGLRIREWDAVLAKGFEAKAQDLHQKLTVSDQAQMRELYLSRIEEVDPKLRAKFSKLYQYY